VSEPGDDPNRLAGPPLRDRFLGGAVADALGAPFEGLWPHFIPEPESLLAGYAEFEGYPRGQYTDDAHLTLATARSVLAAGGVSPPRVARSIAALWARQEVIGPGACTAAAHEFLRTGDWSSCGAPAGQAGIRLGGDVDTLGAIVGSLAGTSLGVGAIPTHLREGVRDRGRIERLALRLHELVTRADRTARPVGHRPPGVYRIEMPVRASTSCQRSAAPPNGQQRLSVSLSIGSPATIRALSRGR
jgi:ADP-ribosylglycohydrolase